MDENQTIDQDRILKINIEEEMKSSYIDYSMSVIVARALPDVRDGFKPVHRRILFGMRGIGNFSNQPYKKCARVVGEVLGKYHPHGDFSVYGALVRMGQEWNMRYKLVDGQGNFGSVDGDSPAAMRYTECRLAKMGEHVMDDIDKDTVDMVNNFDDTLKEPAVMPTKIPNLLVNGGNGIAVGMATNIPTHNLNEVIDGCCAYIDNPEITVDELMQYIPAPDFPTGAYIYGLQGVKDAYETGKGRVVMRAKAEIESDEQHDKIVVTEIPYGVNKQQLIEYIADLVKEGKLEGISNVNDETGRQGMRIVVDVKRDANANIILNKLFKMTALQSSFSVNCIALVNGRPRLLSLQECVKYFVEHRRDVTIRRTKFDLNKAKERAHILEGLKIALDNIDEVIKTIRESYDDADKRLMERFGLSEIQAAAILAMQLRRLQGLERDKIEAELQELMAMIAKYEEILADEAKVLAVVKDELLAMKEKYGDKRRSKIFNHELGKFSEEELIPEEESVVLLTVENYIKRVSQTDFRRQNRGGKGKRGMTTKEEDVISQIITANSHDFLYFFTSQGRIFRMKAYEVPQASLTAKGTAAVNLLNMHPDEKITEIIKHNDEIDPETGYLFMATKKGTIKKTAAKNYMNVRSNGLITIKLDPGDELKWVKATTGKDDIIISTSAGQAIRFNEEDVRAMGRSAMGVRGIRLRPKDEVVGMDVVTDPNQTLIAVSANGYGKATLVSNFPTHKRGGVGIKVASVTEKTGPIVAVHTLDPEASEVIMMSSLGQAIRVAVKDIPVLGRATQGVRIMRLADDDTVASLGIVLPEEKDDIEESEE